MIRSDPRGEYNDLRVGSGETWEEPDQFRDRADTEAADVGWTVLVYVFDNQDQVLLIDEAPYAGWSLPGGVPKPDESLPEAVVREVREETSVDLVPDRPHAVYDSIFKNTETVETWLLKTAVFEAAAKTTEISGDLGVENEEIVAACWFDGLPDDLYLPEMTQSLYRLCLDRRPR